MFGRISNSIVSDRHQHYFRDIRTFYSRILRPEPIESICDCDSISSRKRGQSEN